MSGWLKAAAVYNVVWGLLTVFYPAWLFDLTGIETPSYPFIWQCVGMIVGVYGVGYWIAASDPYRHWPIVLVGFLGKLFGPAGYVSGLLFAGTALGSLPFVSEIPAEFGVTLLTNDLVWWVPFGAMLYGALRAKHAGDESDRTTPEAAMAEFRAHDGRTIAEHSADRPTLVVFLRHSGCTFCKEAVADIAAQRGRIESAGNGLLLVHMSDDAAAGRWLGRHGLGDVPRVSDPGRRLYRSFDLARGRFAQLFGPGVWLRGLAATLRGHLVGKLDGDGFQMPGAFLVADGRIVRACRHETAADRPDYHALACETPAGRPAGA